MAMALGNRRRLINAACKRARLQFGGIGAQAHGAANGINAEQIAQLVNDGIRRVRIELRAVAIVQATYIPRVFDHSALHSQANSEIRDVLLASKLNCADHSGNAAFAESTGNKDAIELPERRRFVLMLQALGFDPVDPGSKVVNQTAMNKRFTKALVRILQFHVLADDADGHLVDGVIHSLDEPLPIFHLGFGFGQMQKPDDLIIQAFCRQHEWDFVDAVHVFRRDDGSLGHVAEQRNLRFHLR